MTTTQIHRAIERKVCEGCHKPITDHYATLPMPERIRWGWAQKYPEVTWLYVTVHQDNECAEAAYDFHAVDTIRLAILDAQRGDVL